MSEQFPPLKDWDYSPRHDGWWFWNPVSSHWMLLTERDFIREANMIEKARVIASRRHLIDVMVALG